MAVPQPQSIWSDIFNLVVTAVVCNVMFHLVVFGVVLLLNITGILHCGTGGF